MFIYLIWVKRGTVFLGDGKEYTPKQHLQRELKKLAPLAVSMAIKMTAILLFALLIKTPYMQAHPVLTKVITGLIAAIFIGWLIKYIRKRIIVLRK